MTPPNADANLRAFDLTGTVAMVTGASSGLGLHFAGVLARAGAAVALAARRKDKVDAAAADLCRQGHRAVGVTLDVSLPQTHGPAFDAVVAALGGPPRVLVNNAGILVSKPFLEQSEDEVMARSLPLASRVMASRPPLLGAFARSAGAFTATGVASRPSFPKAYFQMRWSPSKLT